MSQGEFTCGACGAAGQPAEGRCGQCGERVALEGRFALRRIVGQGAVGTTWRALDLESGDDVAVKEMPLRPGTPLHVRDRMAREARVLRQIGHPRIPAYVAHFEAGSGRHRAFYVVQTFVEGHTLSAEVTDRRLSQAEVVGILDAVLEVLEYLHGLAPPVIHRDLKPGNVIRRASDGELVLIDFGAVRDVVGDPRTGGSTIAGTYGYMAPEQFRGVATAATDLYAVGVMAVALLSRRDVLDLVGPDHKLAWREAVSAAPGFVSLIEQLLADDPADRPASAKAVRAMLAEIDLDAAPTRAGASGRRGPRRPRPPALPPEARFAGLRADLPAGAVARLKDALAVDEPVLWSARPHPSRWAKGGCALAAFAIPWTGFAIFWTTMAATMGSAADDSGPFGYIFPLFGVPFILVGLFMLTTPFRARAMHRQTLYAITDRQVLEVRGPVRPKFVEAFAEAPIRRYRGVELANAERRDRGDGTSDFVLARTKGNKGAIKEHGLFDVPDGDHVAELIEQAAWYDPEALP